ncbi:conserved hypothetical protein [Theileria equi strain WA]|uniref:Uncharacterized protein n=1 Tax=Theileria equi strain WA TaxID=1537102 RepID=L1LGD8_THEEQ|nr:conserved hypothetical protein [Theileria equi strain WA]EKX74426.1 conserved hypothetical protein [Theileria equi strain WA]|eukprot:XP_004833878.1 conserved hypothetical protein [Theileria equi strain WA]
MSSITVKLYGGAITCRLPPAFQDLSLYVPVPDHQEVYLQHIGSTNTSTQSDCVLTFEILQYLEGMDDLSAGSHLFQDLSVCNEARRSQICTCKVVGDVNIGLSTYSRAIIATGNMNVSRRKFKTDESWEDVSVLMYILRIPSLLYIFTHSLQNTIPNFWLHTHSLLVRMPQNRNFCSNQS